MSSERELDEGIKSIKSAWRREHTARANLEKMLQQAETENAKLREQLEYDRQTSRSRLESIDHLKDENAKLRELCRRYGEYVSQGRCEGCVYKTRCNNGLIDECWQRGEIRDLARELGIEVDG